MKKQKTQRMSIIYDLAEKIIEKKLDNISNVGQNQMKNEPIYEVMKDMDKIVEEVYTQFDGYLFTEFNNLEFEINNVLNQLIEDKISKISKKKN